MASLLDRSKQQLYTLLRKTEKYTKTDMVYFAKGSFLLTAGQVISSGATFLLAIAFANFIPRETYGTYKYVLSITSILAITTLRGMEAALTQAVARSCEGAFLPVLKTKMRWGALGGVGSIGLALYYLFMGNTTLSFSFFIIAVFLPFMDAFGIYNSFLQGKKQFTASALYTTISQVVATIIMIVSIALTKNLFVILFVYFASWTLLKLFFLLRTIRKFPPNQKNDPHALSYGKHLSTINITATAIGSLDNVILFHYLGSIELAIYSFALAPVSQLRGLFNQIPILAIPKLAQRPVKEIQQILWKRYFALFGVGLAIAGTYILAAPYLFALFFPRYLDSVLLSQIFSLSIPIALGQTILGAAATAKLTQTPKKTLYLWNIPNAVFILFVLLSISHLGAMGVMISRLISLLSGTLVSVYVWRQIKKEVHDKEEQAVTKI